MNKYKSQLYYYPFLLFYLCLFCGVGLILSRAALLNVSDYELVRNARAFFHLREIILS